MQPIFESKRSRLFGLLAGTASAVCLISLFLTPAMVLSGDPGELLRDLLSLTPYETPLEVPLRLLILFSLCWIWIWDAGSETLLLVLLLILLELTAAILLWQVRRNLSPHSADRRNRP